MIQNKNDILSIRNVIVAILILLLCISGCSAWKNYSKLKDYEKQIKKFTLNEQGFELLRTNDGKLIAQQQQIILTHKQAIDNGLIAYLKLKKLKSQVRVSTITQLDSIFVPFIPDSLVTVYDTVYLDTTTHLSTIQVPKKFSLIEDYYSIGGKVKKDGLIVDSLKIFNQTHINIGLKSQGIFKKPLPVVMVDHTNPYVKTSGLGNIIIKDEKKFYDRKLFWLGVGLIGGITTTALIVK
jgi:hypothetical protein